MDHGHVGQLDRHRHRHRPLHSTEPSLPQMGDISNRHMHRPSRHSVWKNIASHCSLKKHDSLMAAAAGKKITGVYQSGVNVFMHIHTGFDARIQRIGYCFCIYIFLFYCLSRNDMFTSCFYGCRNGTVVFPPSFDRVWGVDVLSILTGVGLVSNRQIFL